MRVPYGAARAIFSIDGIRWLGESCPDVCRNTLVAMRPSSSMEGFPFKGGATDGMPRDRGSRVRVRSSFFSGLFHLDCVQSLLQNAIS